MQNERRKELERAGTNLLLVAGAILLLSTLACVLIQDFGLGFRISDIVGFIAYFGGPLPIIPATLGVAGLLLIAIATLAK
ncbi:MAG: hypothetical protein SH850_13885 [Planctomycetaceae bacterium]|nr:hypothetical protein [Planctomycetaceae bacterium]